MGRSVRVNGAASSSLMSPRNLKISLKTSNRRNSNATTNNGGNNNELKHTSFPPWGNDFTPRGSIRKKTKQKQSRPHSAPPSVRKTQNVNDPESDAELTQSSSSSINDNLLDDGQTASSSTTTKRQLQYGGDSSYS
eukprot:11446805-Ditylum_brightwellii.AAC.1